MHYDGSFLSAFSGIFVYIGGERCGAIFLSALIFAPVAAGRLQLKDHGQPWAGRKTSEGRIRSTSRGLETPALKFGFRREGVEELTGTPALLSPEFICMPPILRVHRVAKLLVFSCSSAIEAALCLATLGSQR